MSVSCTHQIERDFQIAQQESEKGHSRVALSLYDKIIKRYKDETMAIQSAREASKICFFELKDFIHPIQMREFNLKNKLHLFILTMSLIMKKPF
jgi:hypothetical protein